MMVYCSSKMTTIITITGEPVEADSQQPYTNALALARGCQQPYTYDDRILKNILTDEYEVYYSGQNQGRMDHQLKESVKMCHHFRVYYRKFKTDCFTFLGVSTQSSIIRERKTKIREDSEIEDRLQIRLVIQPANIINQLIVPVSSDSNGKYKKAVLAHSGVVEYNKYNLSVGFYMINTWQQILVEVLKIAESVDEAHYVVRAREGAFVSLVFLYKNQEILDSNKEQIDMQFELYKEYIISIRHMVDCGPKVEPC